MKPRIFKAKPGQGQQLGSVDGKWCVEYYQCPFIMGGMTWNQAVDFALRFMTTQRWKTAW